MAAKDLVTLTRAEQSLGGVTSINTTTLASLITAVSDAIEKYCRRDFYSRNYDELYNGNGDNRLVLREYPIVSIQSVRYRPVTVLEIINADQADNQQARVTVTANGLILFTMASGVPTTITSITWTSYPTLIAVANAVNALGNGWQAQVVGVASGDYGLWPSADLYLPPSFQNQTTTPTSQGALTARGVNCELKMHTYEMAGYQFDPRGWLLRAIPYTDPELLHPEDLIWPPGINNLRVQYTAGYQVVPEAVQEACCEWAAELYYRTIRDPSLTSQTLTSQSWGGSIVNTNGKPPNNVAVLLAPYRRYHVQTGQS
jgi:hypothetical protein